MYIWFFIGCLTLTIINRLKFKVPNYSSIIILLLILLFFYLGANQQYDFLIYFFTSALIVSLILSKNSYLNNLLNNKILTFLGTISYAIYMSHCSIIWIFHQFFSSMKLSIKIRLIFLRSILLRYLPKTIF